MLQQQETNTILDGKVKKRCVLYARTSSNDTKTDSLPSQLSVCEAYANEQGYVIIDRLSEDIMGVKGDDRDAPALNKALEMAQAGLYDVLIIRDVKRFSRDVYKAMDFEGRFFDTGINIEYPWNKELNGLPRRGTGFVMRFLQYWMSEEDRKDTVSKLYFKRVEAVKHKNSVLVHGRPPYGYDEKHIILSSTKKRVELVINEDEAKWVIKIFEWYVIDGLSLRKITLRLRDNLVPRPGYKKPIGTIAKRSEFKWNHTTVHDILSRRAYIGEWEYSKNTANKRRRKQNSIIGDEFVNTPVRLEVPRIITDELFNAAQARLEENRKRTFKKSPHKFLLRGRVKCGLCDYACRCTSKTKGNRNYHVYGCNAKSKGKLAGIEHCDLPVFKRDVIDYQVWKWLTDLMDDDKELRKGYDDYIEDEQTKIEPLQTELERIDTSLADYQDRLMKQAQAISTLSDIGSTHAVDALKQDILHIEEMINRHNARRAEIEKKLEGHDIGIPKDFDEFIIAIREGIIEAANRFDKRLKIIESLDVRVIFTVEGGEMVFYPSCTFKTEENPLVVQSFPNHHTTSAEWRIQARIVYHNHL